MSWSNRVVWREGMFLRTQHFQQQDRWTESLVRGVTRALRPHPWGLIDYALDRDLLGTGRFALSSASGMFEDGTPFMLPGEADHPGALDVPGQARNALVYLALPIRQAGGVEVSDERLRRPLRRASVRGLRHAVGLADPGRIAGWPASTALHARSRGARRLPLHRPRAHHRGHRRSPGHSGRALDPAGAGLLGGQPLAGLIAELAGMLNQRGEALAARMTAPGQAGVAQVADFLLLQSINGWQTVVSHWADAASIHPETLYTALVQMAGEFATFLETRRPNTYPAYRHDDLQRSFAPVVADLRRPVGGAGADRDPDPVARGAAWRARGADHRPLDPARVEFRADRAMRHAGRDAAAAVPNPGQDRRGRAHPRTGQCRAAGHRGPAAAGRAAAIAVLRRRHVFRTRPRQPALGADAELGWLRHSRSW